MLSVLLTGDSASDLPDYKKGAKMKKIVFLLVLALLVCSTVPAMAVVPSDNKYVIYNSGATTKVTVVPTALIKPRESRILKMTVTSVLKNGSTAVEAVAGLYDTTTGSSAIDNNMECEIESNDSDSVSYEFARPLRIYNGVVILQGAHTVVQLEWEESL